MYLAYGDKVCREDFKYGCAPRTPPSPRRAAPRSRGSNVSGKGVYSSEEKNATSTSERTRALAPRSSDDEMNRPRRASPDPIPDPSSPHPTLPLLAAQDFMKRRYIRLLPVHWLCIFFYTPIIYYNYRTISEDYYFWQNKSGVLHLWAGWALNPLFLHSWIFAPLHYWNSVGWSVSTQVGFYFLFPRARASIPARNSSPRETSPRGGGDAETGAVAALDASRIEARYRWRARGLYVLSFLVPFAAMAFFNNPAFREYWADPNVPRDAETGKEVVTELGSDIDGIRAYFIARSWTLLVFPCFSSGCCSALGVSARLEPATRRTRTSRITGRGWRTGTRSGSSRIGSSPPSAAYAESKPVRLFSEFFLIYPAAYVIYGLTIAGEESRVYRLLTHPVMRKGGQISYAAYLLQFPVWSYVDWFAYGTFKGRFPPCSRDDPEDVSSWTECFAKSGYQEWPDVMVVWNVFLLFVVAYFVNRSTNRESSRGRPKSFSTPRERCRGLKRRAESVEGLGFHRDGLVSYLSAVSLCDESISSLVRASRAMHGMT